MSDNSGNSAGEKRDSLEGSKPSRLWVPIVILIGAIIGMITFDLFPPIFILHRPPSPGEIAYLQELFTLIAIQVILTTISIALLVSLLIVYIRTWRQTRANFVLGLTVVLFALLLQSLLTYPPIFVLIQVLENAPFASNSEFFSPLADIFTVIAYSVFLYLSLQ